MLDVVFDPGCVVLFRVWRGGAEVLGCATVIDREFDQHETRLGMPVEWYLVEDGRKTMLVKDTSVIGRASLLEALVQSIP